jgi:hypothetical protein
MNPFSQQGIGYVSHRLSDFTVPLEDRREMAPRQGPAPNNLVCLL